MSIVAAIAVPHPPIMLPQVGRGEEKKIQKTIDAYRAAMVFLAGQQPETVIIASPHAELYGDWFHISPGEEAAGDFATFGAAGLAVAAQYDSALAEAIEAEAQRQGLPAGRLGQREARLDHGTAIPLLFLQEVLPAVKVVRVGLSGQPVASHYRLGQCMAAACGNKRVAFIASGDLSHKLKEEGPYGYAPEGPQLDAEITEALAAGDFGRLLDISPVLAEEGAECGLRAFIMMAGALDGQAVEAKLLCYEGPFGVGYGVATFLPGGPQAGRQFLQAYSQRQQKRLARLRSAEDPWVALARQSLTTYVTKGHRLTLPGGLPKELTDNQAGVFVSLHKEGQLRGCIGTIAPTLPSVAEEIIQNAVSACSEDPRFDPVAPDELDQLEINVDVLGHPEEIDSEQQLDPKRYGVIVSSGGRRGLLLPDLEGVDTPSQQVDIARRKAGIPDDVPLRLQRFEVIRHV